MERLKIFLMTAILMLCMSTTCADETLYNISVINNSSEPVKYIRYISTSNEDDRIGYNFPIVLNPGEKVSEFIAVEELTDWDNIYQEFVFYSGTDDHKDNKHTITGCKLRYNLRELKNINWTVVYNGTEE